MLRIVVPLIAALATPVTATELQPVPVVPLAGRPYPGTGEPAEIRFINARPDRVQVAWLDLAGRPVRYATLDPGQEYVQTTYVTHRWMVQREGDSSPLVAFIATRSVAEGGGADIAVIR